MEKPKNHEQTHQSDRESKIQSLINRKITPILPFELEILREKARSSDISDDTEAQKAMDIIKNSSIVEYPGSDIDTITLGSQFTVEYKYTDDTIEQETYVLTGTDHDDVYKISVAKITSPIGKLLFGAKEGDVVVLPLANDRQQSVTVKILKIEQVN
jgi:transcription elongation GreA/GreB family factor